MKFKKSDEKHSNILIHVSPCMIYAPTKVVSLIFSTFNSARPVSGPRTPGVTSPPVRAKSDRALRSFTRKTPAAFEIQLLQFNESSGD